MDLCFRDLRALAAEMEGVRSLQIPLSRYQALHEACDEVEAVLDSRYLRCGDCNERMSAADVLSHVCEGRFCRVQCGDCGQYVDGDRVSEHVCGSMPVFPGSPLHSAPTVGSIVPRRSDVAQQRRQTDGPFTLEDVHLRLELLSLELSAVMPEGSVNETAGTVDPFRFPTPWWELFTPDACEQLLEAIGRVRAVLDERFLKCGDCFKLIAAEDIARHSCRDSRFKSFGLGKLAANVKSQGSKTIVLKAEELVCQTVIEQGALECWVEEVDQLCELDASLMDECSENLIHRPDSSKGLDRQGPAKRKRFLRESLKKADPVLEEAPTTKSEGSGDAIGFEGSGAVAADVVAVGNAARSASTVALPSGAPNHDSHLVDSTMVDALLETMPTSTKSDEALVAPRRRAWSTKEDQAICELVSKHGQDFVTIATRLPGRTADAVRNRWGRLKGGGKLPASLSGHSYRCTSCGEPKRGHRCSAGFNAARAARSPHCGTATPPERLGEPLTARWDDIEETTASLTVAVKLAEVEPLMTDVPSSPAPTMSVDDIMSLSEEINCPMCADSKDKAPMIDLHQLAHLVWEGELDDSLV